MTDIRPFHVSVDDDTLADLTHRLQRARFLDDSPGRPLSGMDAEYLRELVTAWGEFDWRSRETWLNRHPQFIADVSGDDVHFVHLRSQDPQAPALLVMHGWPHTFALQLDFAELLSDFHVVLPSFPGFAFSPPYSDRPFLETHLADTMHALMTDVLGYDSYLTYGEDVSANVSDLIAARHPESVAGILVTHAHFPTAQERERLDADDAVAFFTRLADESYDARGYEHIQSTRPDTLAAALNDSPAGLLSWIVEKHVEWADAATERPASIESRISRERILTEATIYWVTQSIGTSFRPYFESPDQASPIPPVEVPAAVHIQSHEHDYPESLAREFYRDLRVFERLSGADISRSPRFHRTWQAACGPSPAGSAYFRLCDPTPMSTNPSCAVAARH
ncbi:epoxide hydrolase family protein [Microbacterium phyllosphaerae]|uniref:epoxide hydrolase family protein n=1 Tax=Microbacterium phyllosphaerae TaxID=124798 RepID=UPI001FCA05A1|nr:epoxide hydrolase [Microbacterium phyllosphaerae]